MSPDDPKRNLESDRSQSTFKTAAYGGDGWSARTSTHREEIGTVWSSCGIDSEWRHLKEVILHKPGAELAKSLEDHDAVQMLAPMDLERAAEEHAAIAAAYADHGVKVHHVAPVGPASPNQMFCADLFVMTPEGAIVARPASTVRAGEERWIARRLADLGVPILRTLTGTATFEGADLMWLDAETAVIGRGLRTNQAAIEQITSTLEEIGCKALGVDMPYGTMHLKYFFEHHPDRERALAEMHTLADVAEMGIPGFLTNPFIVEPLAVLMGGGAKHIDRGMDAVRLIWGRMREEYLSRCELAGFDRRSRTQVPEQPPY